MVAVVMSVRIVFVCKRQKTPPHWPKQYGSCHIIISSSIQISGVVSGMQQCRGQPLCILLIFPPVHGMSADIQPLFLLSKQEEVGTWKCLLVACVPLYQGREIPQKSLRQISPYLWGQRVKDADEAST